MSSIINSDSVKPVTGKTKKGQWKLAIGVLAGSALLAGVTYPYLVPDSGSVTVADYDTALVTQLDLSRTTQASGTVQIPTQMIVSAPDEGYSAALMVAVGDTVTKDQVIAQIDLPDLDETIEDYQASLISAELSLERTILDYRNSVENSEANIRALEDDVSDLIDEVEKYEALVDINAARQSDLELLLEDLETAETKVTDAKRELSQTHALHSIDLKSGQANIDMIETQLARALAEKEDASIKSPMTGEVLEIADILSVTGSTVEKGEELFTIVDPASSLFDLEISEEYANEIALGEWVPVTVGSYVYSGEITFIGKVAQTSSDGLGATIQVKVAPETYSSDLLLGSTAIGVFTLGVEEDALTLPRGSYLTTGSQKFVYVVEGDAATKVNVTYGEIEGNTVQITSGLDAGDRVITSGYQAFISENIIKLAGE